MKRVLLIVVAAMMISSVAMADAIGVYTDASGGSCNLAAGFTQTATVIYMGWTPGGSTGARFKVVGPPGTSLFAFNTPYVTIGNIAYDLSIAFGGCIQGPFPMGTIVGLWAAGPYGAVLPSDGFPNILMTDCSFGEYPATGFNFCVALQGECWGCVFWDATEQSTWGKVKALYR